MVAIGSLILECTRRCNLQCAHCLRGCAENKDMNPKVLEKLKESVGQIYTVSFSGGEPMLNPKVIHQYNKYFKNCTGLFFIATNGTIYSPDAMSALVELFAHCEEPEICCLAVSRDQFRDELDYRELQRYQAYSFYSDSTKNGDIKYVINSGLAIENGVGVIAPKIHYQLEVKKQDENTTIEEIYINVNGDVLASCDLSYEDREELSLGNILEESLEEIIEREIARIEALMV